MENNVAIISLSMLIAVIVISIVTKKNAGLLGIIGAFIVALIAQKSGMNIDYSKIVTSNWPVALFFLIMSTTLLFGIATVNGTTKVLSQNIVCVAGGRKWLIPIVFFVFGAVVSGAGGGGLIVAAIAPIALQVAVQNNISVLMMSLVTMGGIMAGGLSPVAINGVVGSALIAKEGIQNYSPFWISYAVSMTAFSFAAYLIFGGLKSGKTENKPGFEKFNTQQLITIITIGIVIVGSIIIGRWFKSNAGLLGLLFFICASLLIIFGAVDQNKAISSVPWGTILLICGMAVLISVIKSVGAISFLTSRLEPLMTSENIAQPIFVIMGGLLGAVSSGTGVVMPTLIPIASGIAASSGGSLSALALIIGVMIGTNGVVISPLSTVGGICLASAPESVNRYKLFNQLLLSAVMFIIFNVAASAAGLFAVFYN